MRKFTSRMHTTWPLSKKEQGEEGSMYSLPLRLFPLQEGVLVAVLAASGVIM